MNTGWSKGSVLTIRQGRESFAKCVSRKFKYISLKYTYLLSGVVGFSEIVHLRLLFFVSRYFEFRCGNKLVSFPTAQILRCEVYILN